MLCTIQCQQSEVKILLQRKTLCNPGWSLCSCFSEPNIAKYMTIHPSPLPSSSDIALLIPHSCLVYKERKTNQSIT